MKSVLISIRPKWCALIASGKTRPPQSWCYVENNETEERQ